ncbi:MAG: hypothetical protein ACTS73_06855 [Arsenophonus sp. NEOnobi-MAG3]
MFDSCAVARLSDCINSFLSKTSLEKLLNNQEAQEVAYSQNNDKQHVKAIYQPELIINIQA